MSVRSLRYRFSESNNIWPGFVDVLATLLIVIIFVLMVFTVSQILGNPLLNLLVSYYCTQGCQKKKKKLLPNYP